MFEDIFIYIHNILKISYTYDVVGTVLLIVLLFMLREKRVRMSGVFTILITMTFIIFMFDEAFRQWWLR